MLIMTKTTTKNAPAPQGDAGAPNTLPAVQNAFTEMFDKSNDVDGEDLSSEYINFEEDYGEGVEVKLVVIGITEIDNAFESGGETSEAVEFVDRHGAKCINADTMVVSTIKRVFKGEPILVGITFKGMKKAKNSSNKYRDFLIKKY